MNKVYDCIANTTKTLTWISSGVTPSAISCALIKWDETLISSVAATSSGNGHYYAEVVHPGSAQWLVNEWRATVNGNLRIHRQFGEVRVMQVSS
jgi:hypothetical protein